MSLKNETTIHRLFDERGFSESFDFIGKVENGKREVDFSYRCKCCGAVNVRQASYYLYRYPKLICGNCGASSDGENIWNRSRECNEAMKYYKSGHSVAETAERFGVTKVQISNAVKARGITNGRSFSDHEKHLEKQKQKAINDLMILLDDMGFEYVGGYVNRKRPVVIRCKECGFESSNTVVYLRKKKKVCLNCKRIKVNFLREEQKRIKQELKEKSRKKKEAERIMNNPLGLSYYQQEREKKLDEVHNCKVCGKEYTVRQYMESTGSKYARNSGYCSAECRDVYSRESVKSAHKNRRDSHRHRAKKVWLRI